MPLVSIGLPVYNGEVYLRDAIDSILNQDFTDFELIISDNASSDSTQEICREYEKRDSRIHYIRTEQNLGASINYNKTFESATGKYFKWAAHDDLHHPEFLSRCLEVMEDDQDVVLAYPRVINVDGSGKEINRDTDKLFLKEDPESLNANSPTAHVRFRTLTLSDHKCYSVFGLIRSDILRKTPLIGSYVGSDRTLLAELSLWGRFHELDEYLFYHRQHNERSMRAYPDPKDRVAWFDPKKKNTIVLRFWRILTEYFLAIWRVPLSFSVRLGCCFQLVRWVRWNFKKMIGDLVGAIGQLAG